MSHTLFHCACVCIIRQLASLGFHLLSALGEEQAAAAATQKAFIDEVFPLCKLHTEPLKADEPNEQAIGRVPVDRVPVQ